MAHITDTERAPAHTAENDPSLPPEMSDPPQLRCSVVVFRDDAVVLVRRGVSSQPDTPDDAGPTGIPESGEPLWDLPGGPVALGEGVLGCARRRLREQTGLEAASLRCAFVLDTTDPHTGSHTAEIVCLAFDAPGRPARRGDGTDAQLVPLSQVGGLRMRPAILGNLRGLHHSRRGPARAAGFDGPPTAPLVEVLGRPALPL